MRRELLLRPPLLPFRLSCILLSSLVGIDAEFFVEEPCKINIFYLRRGKTIKNLCKLASRTARSRFVGSGTGVDQA